MAARFARTIAALASSSPAVNEGIVAGGISKLRWASSSSYSYSSEEETPATGKPNKKLADRISGVIDAINDRKLPPEIRGQRNAVRSETDIVNVVEQRVWHAMEEGQFENLAGKGKPLDLSSNPHADPAEDTLYRILSRNKCAPEWVELNKEIRNDIAIWRSTLKKAWVFKEGGDESKWMEFSEPLKLQVRSINDKVEGVSNRHNLNYFMKAGFRYNLIVPFGRQMCGLNWEKELSRVKEEYELS